jgi:general secretion pathway protein D
VPGLEARGSWRARWLAAALLAWLAAGMGPAGAQQTLQTGQVQLDFNDVELSVVIDTIAQLTGTNFIYDDKVRGRVTVISPAPMSKDQAYAVFESILQVKGFTTVKTPGGVVKIIPIRDAKESSVETLQGRQITPDRDRFVTRLIPLQYIDAEAIANTLKPLVSKEASMVSYAPTNTIILTDSAANIRRLLGILDAIDVETYKEHLAVLKVHHGDAATLAQQLSEIYGAETSAPQPAGRVTPAARRRAAQAQSDDSGPQAGRIRILTDERTNSLIVLASRSKLEDIRGMVRRLDIPVTGGGRIHVHYLKHADAEELANTLTSLVSGQPAAPAGAATGAARGGQVAALRAAVTELSEGATITADAATNSLVIQASQEGYRTIATVIEKLDIPRPQVLVEALIMEVNISDNSDLGFSGIARLAGSPNLQISSAPSDNSSFPVGQVLDAGANAVMPGAGFVTNFLRNSLHDFDANGNARGGTLIQGIIRANASNGDTNIISAPHILTSDNEEAEITIGNNIPIITSRVESAAGQETNLATSVNVERQEIGVTLRVTPQITEGDSLRLEIFQEITNIDENINVGDVEDVGPALTNRRVENTVVVSDDETVVIGGLISDDYSDTVSKVPWLGDIPVLGWLFKTEGRNLRKINLLIFLTPHIIRQPADLEYATLRKREEFRQRSTEALELSEKERQELEEKNAKAVALGLPPAIGHGRNPARRVVQQHEERYPLERMREIEQGREQERRRKAEQAEAGQHAPRYSVLAAVFGTEAAATTTLVELVDGGYDGFILSGDSDGALLYQVIVGPYPDVATARDIAAAIRAGFGLAPTVMVGEPLARGDDTPTEAP